MADLKQTLKSLVLANAPPLALSWLKKRHYVRAVREFAERDVAAVRRLVAAGDRVVDIGANVGWYTHLLSQCVGPTGHVMSVEPIPPTFELLSHCVRELGLCNVELRNCAVSDAAGSVRMQIPDYRAGGENFYQAHVVSGDPRGRESSLVAVPSTTLDELVEGAVRFVKCDVEGHEASVIEGALGLIEEHHPIWLLEINDDPDEPDSAARRLIARLAQFGYSPYWFDGDVLRARSAGDRSINYFFLTDEQRADSAASIPFG